MKRLLLAVLIAILIIDTASESCNSPGLVRLTWGAGTWEGNVQVCLNGNWGWVCHNSFSTADAQVVCHQLGYSTGGAVARTASYYGWPGNGTIWMDYVSCVGTESSLVNCNYATNLNSACNYQALAGVVCQSGGTCNNQDIRLISVSSSIRSYGRVEVCLNNQWGTVCDDGWGTYDARAACRQLGHYDGSSYCCAYYGQGYVPIAMRNVGCSSNAYSLFSCSYTANSIGCSHSEDAGARCYGRLTSSCSSGQVRLWRPYATGPSNEGIALYCRSGSWRASCNYNVNCHTARVMCLEMGYTGAVGIKGYGTIGLYNYLDEYTISCSSSHTRLNQCNNYRPGYYYYYYGYRFQSYCTSYSRTFGVVCYAPAQGTECTNGTVRLVNGSTTNEGRVEYCYEGNWAPFCSMSSITASVICSHLNYTYASVFNDERFGRSNTLSSFNHKYCSTNQQSWSQCTEVRKGSSCYITFSQCSTEYGLRCYNPGACNNDGQLRLVNGTIEQEGRVEICLNGVWGTICETGWDTNDAFVFCKGLGYNGQNPNTYYNAHFGETYGPIIWSNMACTGYETGIQNCNKNDLLTFNCTQQNTAGVTCKDACQNGDVKLIGGKYSNEGTVLVCYNNLWGLISDSAWTNGDARVVCNGLGYSEGIAEPVLGSYYGKPNLVVHFRDVSCFPQDTNIIQCSKTTLSFENGKLALATDNVAGVDCIYDEPTDCIKTPSWVSTPGSQCSPVGRIRLQGSQIQGNGRLEYCYNGYWSPFCNLDPATASVACKELGFTTYTAASIVPTDSYGVVQNFSLFVNITCTGTESTVSQCAVHTSECTPWCPFTNIAITCFNPGTCTDGEIRLMDGIIENEGRIEICYNGVWGAICDQGWDGTDAHVVCTQMGHPELEPVVLSNSTFGAGQYPIVYSNFACGGWENELTDCDRQVYPQSNCSRNHVAGLLCGHDCNDGDTRLVGSQYSYEGTIEICYGHIWGLISDSGWSIQDAEVVCRQLGYQTQGTVPYYNSYFGKPNKTIHMTDILCTGHEDTISDCTRTTLSLQQGRDMLEQTSAAGVKCYSPDWCITPPTQGISCTHGQIRLTGGQPTIAEGNLEYCYYGSWSLFCYLGPQEAVVACRQLGYTQYEVTAVFDDGRFGLSAVYSLFQNFSCINTPTAASLRECDLLDSCQSKCQYPIGLRCYESTNCQDGDVRLVNGSSRYSGRLEVCSNSIWGSVCGTGFSVTDAYVVCRELGLGISEPTVYTNSYFGDGNEAIVYSNFQCGGYESSVGECGKQQYGSFVCSRDNIVGIICRDNCSFSDIRLVGGPTASEGTVEVCYYNTWGLVSDDGWTDKEALVVCRQLNFNISGANAVTGSHYGKPNRTIQLTNVVCNRSQPVLDLCDKDLLTPQEGAAMPDSAKVAGVHCQPTVTVVVQPPGAVTSSQSSHGIVFYAVIGALSALFIITLLVAVSFIVYAIKQRKLASKYQKIQTNMRMSSLSDRGVENPLANLEAPDDYDDGKKLVYEITQ